VIEGGSASHLFGNMLAVGDVDGDGLADLIIGAPKYGDSDTGAIYIIFGQETWEPSIDVTTSSLVLIVPGDVADATIGGDIFVTDSDGNGAVEIYTLKNFDSVYLIDLFNTSSSDQNDNGGTTNPTFPTSGLVLGGGGCQLIQSPTNMNSQFIWLALFSLSLFFLFLRLNARKKL